MISRVLLNLMAREKKLQNTTFFVINRLVLLHINFYSFSEVI